MTKVYALYFEGQGFATQEDGEFRFTSDAEEALQWDRETAEALAHGLAEGLRDQGLSVPRVGLVDWVEGLEA